MTRQTILFVDDEESILEIAKEYFSQKGYDVITATDGLSALKVLKNTAIDCCFTDINMPGMNGLELAEYIRNLDNTIPVIVVTGYPSLENTLKTLKNGVVDFLIKPVNLGQMELCIQRVLRERKLFAENMLLKQEVERKKRIEELNLQLSEKVEELHTLNKILVTFPSIGTTQDVFKHLVQMAREITHADVSRFFIINPEMPSPFQVAMAINGQTQPHSASGTKCIQVGPLASDSYICQIVGQIVQEPIPLLIAENTDQMGVPPDIRSLMAVPLTIREKLFGVLLAFMHEDTHRFDEKDLYYLSFMTHNAAYAIENLALYENIYENLLATLIAFVKAIEAKDPYTEQHSSRVTGIARLIASKMGCSDEELDVLNVAGRLHDIGKIGIQDEILLKPSRLTDEEFKIIQKHPVIGAEIVGQLGVWETEKQIIRHHHERMDGSGYPDGLAGDQIPLLARILSVADAYDAMASDRIYRKKMTETQIIHIIESGSGSQFDPQVVAVFKELHAQGIVIRTN